MKPLDHCLARLLRCAAAAPRPAPAEPADPEPPFGFETRVLAALTATGSNAGGAVFDAVFRRALTCAASLMLFSVGLSYGALTDYVAMLREPEAQAVQRTNSEVSASLDFAR